MEYIPVGSSREQGGQSSLSIVKNHDRSCLVCGETVAINISFISEWGRPSTPGEIYCKNCSQRYELGLIPV